MEWNRLREKLLEEFGPEEQELGQLKNTYHRLSEFIEDRYGLETHFAGSAARGTCLKDDADIDLFVLFPPEVGEEDLENRGLEIGRETLKQFGGEPELEYAEHPYVQGEVDGIPVEIVPCYDVPSSEIKSSVDRTPHHSRWVDENLSEEEREEVVLLKQFLLSRGIYGSSLKVRGFSGYLCEVMVSEHGSLPELAEEAREWDRREVIDPADHHGGELPEELDQKFDSDGLVVVDPVDPERNVASVLTLENYSRFIYACHRFHREPGYDSFVSESREITSFELSQRLERRADVMAVEFDTPDAVEDVIHPQMRKTVRVLERELEDSGFRLYSSGYFVGGEKTRILLELDAEIREAREVTGPAVFHGGEHIEEFRQKYGEVYVEGERLKAMESREHPHTRELLKQLLSDEPSLRGVPDRVAEQISSFTFVNPSEGSKEWLKYVADELQLW